MTTPFTYDFGYTFWVSWGHLVPIALFGAVAVLGAWLGWRTWIVVLAGAGAAWGVAGLLITHLLFRINLPEPPASPWFLSSTDEGRVLDVGAGSGRATVGLLLDRPRVTVTAVDIYRGNYGIDDNTPERLLANVRRAGAEGRADAMVGDARELPLPDSAFDGVISVAAIDHLPRAGVTQAVAEASRVLKPGGEFLLTVVRVDGWAWVASPHAMAHHRFLPQIDWPRVLEAAGFTLVEQGTRPGSRYFLARKRSRAVEAADRD